MQNRRPNRPVPPVPNYPSNVILGRKIKNINKRLRVLTPELKYSNHIENAVNSSYDGALRTIATTVAQGDTDTTREGDQLRLKNCELRMWFNSAVTSCGIRVIVFIDKQNTSTTVTDVLESGTIGAANTTNAINGLYVHDYKSKYRVLMDRVIPFSANGRNTESLVHRFRFKEGLIQEYVAGGTAPIRNAIKMIFISGNASGTTPSVAWQSRSNFIDV